MAHCVGVVGQTLISPLHVRFHFLEGFSFYSTMAASHCRSRLLGVALVGFVLFSTAHNAFYGKFILCRTFSAAVTAVPSTERPRGLCF